MHCGYEVECLIRQVKTEIKKLRAELKEASRRIKIEEIKKGKRADGDDAQV